MKAILTILGLTLQLLGTHSLLIIPDEIPSLLSVVYSNIPTIKKGTDSRVGWGFRLGNRADFQVLVELGPQTNTQPLANQAGTGSNKRDVPNSLRNILYAQQQDRKKHISNTDGGKWINNWSQSIKNVEETRAVSGAKPGLAIGEIDAKSVIPDDSVLELEKLYRQNSQKQKAVDSKSAPTDSVVSMVKQLYGDKSQEVVTTQKPKAPTPASEALDNVDME